MLSIKSNFFRKRGRITEFSFKTRTLSQNRGHSNQIEDISYLFYSGGLPPPDPPCVRPWFSFSTTNVLSNILAFKIEYNEFRLTKWV